MMGHPIGQSSTSFNNSQPQQLGSSGMQFNQAQIQNGAAMLADGMNAMGVNSVMSSMVMSSAAPMMGSFAQNPVVGWFPTAMISLRHLFNVGHYFVLRKCLVLLCPFIPDTRANTPSWANGGDSPGPGYNNGGEGSDSLKLEVEEPDLYIPTMSYVTYVLLYGVQRGMKATFKPEVLSSTFSFAFVLLLLEVAVIYMVLYFVGNPLPPMQLAANCGYKYIHAALMVVVLIMVRLSSASLYLYYPCFLYLAASAGWATRRFLLHLDSKQIRSQYSMSDSGMTTHVISAVAVAQVVLCWLLSP